MSSEEKQGAGRMFADVPGVIEGDLLQQLDTWTNKHKYKPSMEEKQCMITCHRESGAAEVLGSVGFLLASYPLST